MWPIEGARRLERAEGSISGQLRTIFNLFCKVERKEKKKKEL